MFAINVITQLLSFLILAIIVNQLNFNALIALFLFFLAIILYAKSQQFSRTIKKFNWLFLVMIIIFAFNTPGEHLANWPFAVSPTYEGLTAGFIQILRIALMLAALSLILAANTRQQLISGFYFIFFPLKYLGFEVERFAARLWLTLHYVEQQRDDHARQDLSGRLKEMTNIRSNQDNDEIEVAFKRPQFNLADYLVIALLIAFVMFSVAL